MATSSLFRRRRVNPGEIMGESSRTGEYESRPPTLTSPNVLPLASASFFSQFTYSWLTPIMTLGNERALTTSDLWEVDQAWSATRLSSELDAALKSRKGADAEPSLTSAVNDVAGSFFWIGGVCKVFADISQLMGPVLIKTIIGFAKERSMAKASGVEGPPLTKGILAAMCLFLLTMTTSLIHHQFFWRSIMTGVLARTALISSMYMRAVSLSTKSRSKLSNATILNYISTDVSRVEAAAQWFHPVWSAPIQVSICLGILLLNLGRSALAGFALFTVIIPLQKRILGRQFRIRKRLAKLTELRTKSLLEALGSMHFVKCYTLETPFLRRISALRQEELSGIKGIQNVQSANAALAFSLPVLAATLSFIAFSRAGDFDLAVMFASLSLFQLLRQPMTFWPRALSLTTDALTSLRRLTAIYQAEAVGGQSLVIDPGQQFALSVESATFQWDLPEEHTQSISKENPTPKSTSAPFTLRDVNLHVPRGSLVAIIGPIASGKSSALQGLIGEMRRTAGEVTFCGKAAYCPQVAWIQKGTIRDNIIFGQSFDGEKYSKVLKDVCLEDDLEDLPHGDYTQIGDDGITLSGGQRQRISLARALYHDGDILLLDDPLSSVDPRIGRQIFENVILYSRQIRKTVVMVTYDRSLLSQCDRVLYMQEGRVVAQGSYRDAGRGNVQIGELDQSYVLVGPESVPTKREQTKEEPQLSFTDNVKGKARKPTSSQGPPKRTTPQKVYRTYFRAAGGAFSALTLMIATVVMQACQIWGSRSLVWWQSNAFHRSLGFYQALYGALGLLQASSTFFLGTTADSISCLVSRNVHDGALSNIIHAPMSFFESTPRGAIMSVLGKDTDSLDNQLPASIRTLCLTVATALGSVTVIVYVQPHVAVVAVVTCAGYYHFHHVCQTTSKQLKRIESNLRSNVYAHFTESLDGVQTLRNYNQIDRSVSETNRLLDLQNRASFLSASSQRWLSVRLDFCGAVLIFSVALCAVLGVGTVGAAQIGLILTYTTTLTQMAGLLTRQIADVELQMNSVERLSHYLEPAIRETSPTTQSLELPLDWPQQGRIRFNDVSMNYQPGSPDVLHNISFTVRPGEKLAIVGRTGAGKSSLVNCLMRIVGYSGSIEIDGVDISTVCLKSLRSKISFVPQQPVVFGGTIRSTLDPHGQFEDIILGDSLQRAIGEVRSLEDNQYVSPEAPEAFRRCFNLDTVVEPGGVNLSLGERALLSLTRVLVRDSKIVILDEATATIDRETDENVQKAIRKEFKDRTLICIAHRMKTVLSYDRVLVLDGGKIVESDTPLKLFEQGGFFHELCARSHITSEDIVATKWAY